MFGRLGCWCGWHDWDYCAPVTTVTGQSARVRQCKRYKCQKVQHEDYTIMDGHSWEDGLPAVPMPVIVTPPIESEAVPQKVRKKVREKSYRSIDDE